MARGIAHREWRIHRDQYGSDEDFRGAVQAEFAMCENIGERLGVAIVATPGRVKVGDSWFTRAWLFRTATVPSMTEDEQPGEVEALEQALAATPDTGEDEA